jgi:hypothetical protein
MIASDSYAVENGDGDGWWHPSKPPTSVGVREAGQGMNGERMWEKARTLYHHVDRVCLCGHVDENGSWRRETERDVAYRYLPYRGLQECRRRLFSHHHTKICDEKRDQSR